MSEEKNKESAASAAAAGAAAQKVIEVLKTNATARYAAIGGAAAIMLGIFMSGGDGGTKMAAVQLSAGQTVTVENPNGGNSMLAVAPGMMAVADPEDTEQNVCLVKGAAKGKVEEEQVAGMLSYVKVTMTDGECKGKTGWTSKTNVRAG